MNRAQRRRTERDLAKLAARPEATPVVRLEGGPMDGWLVKPDAPCLQEGWGPPRDDYDYGAGKGKWGRYGPVTRGEDGVQTSAWEPDP